MIFLWDYLNVAFEFYTFKATLTASFNAFTFTKVYVDAKNLSHANSRDAQCGNVAAIFGLPRPPKKLRFRELGSAQDKSKRLSRWKRRTGTRTARLNLV